MSLLDPFMEQVSKLWARVDLTPVVRWGTVTAASPLRVILDGDTTPLPFAPQTAVRGLTVGARVVCVEQHRRVIIVATRGDDTGWVNLDLPEGMTSLTPARYRVKNGIAYLAGAVSGTIAANTQIATIPILYRPSQYVRAAGPSSSGSITRVNIDTNGVVFGNAATGAASIAWQSLDGITWPLN